MRTVHETEALRPSDPVPKHHSSNPSNKFQRIKLVLSEAKKAAEKGSTPASPSSHPPNSATVPLSGDAEYSHNNVVYIQDLASPDAQTMVQFPPDVTFTPRELALPAPQLFRLLRRQLLWATQEGEQLRAEAEALEKKRKGEWIAKELLVENIMEAELVKKTRALVEAGEPDNSNHVALLNADIIPSKRLKVDPIGGKMPWWREDDWLERRIEKEAGGLPVPEGSQSDSRAETTATADAT